MELAQHLHDNGRGFPPQIHPLLCIPAKLKVADSQPVFFAYRRLLQKIAANQRIYQRVHGAFSQPDHPGNFGDAKLLIVLKIAENIERAQY